MTDNVDHERDIWEARRILERVLDVECVRHVDRNCELKGDPVEHWCLTCSLIRDSKRWMDGTEWVDNISWEPRDE